MFRRTCSTRLLLIALAAGVPACAPQVPATPETSAAAHRVDVTPPPCTEPGNPTLDAYDTATAPGAGQGILPNGRLITPAGDQVQVELFPMNVISSPDSRYVYVTNGGSRGNSIQQIDVATRQIVASLALKDLFHGLVVSKDGKRLYAAAGSEQLVHAIDVGAPGLTLSASWNVGGWPTGLALSPDGNRLLVAANLGFEVLELDPSTGDVRRNFKTGKMPYQIAISPDGLFAYVSLWSDKSVDVIELATGRVTYSLTTAKNPSGLVLSAAGDRLYVAAADGDVVEVFDTDTRKSLSRTPVGAFAEGLHGASPVSLSLSADGALLYVANAGDNAVEVYTTSDLAFKGAVPTGWYPSALTRTPDGKHLVVANAKGEGAGPNLTSHAPEQNMKGTISFIDLPLGSSQLAEGEARVIANNTRPATLHEINCAGKMFPVPVEGMESPIKHVVLIMRENKTYDAYLGDLEVGNGDPAMALFDETITPNTHQLAREFTVLDNFYTESEDSDQGHLLATSTMVNDYKERTAHSDRPTDTGVLPASDTLTRYIFDHLWANGIDWVNYGEVVGLGAATWKNIDLRYPGVFYNMSVKDQKKAEYVADRVLGGFMPAFTFLLLPNDHTHGTDPGKLTPESMVSDNDYAVGLVVDAISKSEYWSSTAIFIFEDDPQTGADHVDAHRSPAIVVSPWAKRGHVSSVLYSIPSIIRTTGLILGFDPLTQYDALATPMYDAFTATPDFSAYDALPRQIPDEYNPENGFGAEESRRMDFSGPDRNPGLGRLLWRYMKGSEPPPGSTIDEDELEEELEEEKTVTISTAEALERIRRYAEAVAAR